MSGSVLLDLSPEKPVAVRFAHAALVLNLRARCTGYRTAAVALGVRHCAPRPGIPVAARQAAARIHGVSGVLYGSRDTAACGSLDPARGIAGSAPGAVECLLDRTPVAVDHAGNHWCRSRIARTGCVVCRCPALWVETNKNFRSQAVGARLSDLTSSRAFGARHATNG